MKAFRGLRAVCLGLTCVELRGPRVLAALAASLLPGMRLCCLCVCISGCPLGSHGRPDKAHLLPPVPASHPNPFSSLPAAPPRGKGQKQAKRRRLP